MRLPRPHWNTPSPPASLPEASVEIWRLHLSELGDAPLEHLLPLTVSQEHERARRYRQDDDRHRHLAGRALLRAVLSFRYGLEPRALSIKDDKHGKPYVAQELGGKSAPQINVAHAADVVVVALSREHPVGIDVEALERGTDTDGLADRVLTDTEQQYWLTQPESMRARFFIHVWTCKEAFLKATGTGLRRDTKSVECRVDDGTVVGIHDRRETGGDADKNSAPDWGLCVFLASDGVAGAVARKQRMPSSPLFAEGCPLILQQSSAS